MIVKIILISIILLSLDFIYLNITKNNNLEQILRIQGTKLDMKLYSAILCYITLVFGIYYFIIKNGKSSSEAFILGLVIYGVYDFTNYAIFSEWSAKSVFIDVIWGGILFGLTTEFTYAILDCLYANKIKK